MLITETDETGILIKDYIWNEMHPVAQIDAVIPAQAGIQSIETISYLYTDHLMTNRLATDRNGIITWRWEGEAFGNTPAQELGTVSVNLWFPGQYYDSETNLHYNWNRYYDPALGRYITSDPIGLGAGENTYNYVNSNSIANYDLYGLEAIGEWGYGGVRLRGINSDYLGVEFKSPGFDIFGFITIIRVNYEVSGTIVVPVKCEDEENCRKWERTYNVNKKSKVGTELGPNLYATLIGAQGGPLAAAMVNILANIAKFQHGVKQAIAKFGSETQVTIALINAYGPTYICNNGLPPGL